jgi:cytoskeleton protein RodZ
MTSIGDTLRRERLRRNIELPKIAGELKISARFLDAIERDDFGKLPGGVFTKSFVRQYASYLGLDAEEMAAEVQRAIAPQPEIPQAPGNSKPSVPGIAVQMLEDNWQSVRERRTPLPSWLRAGVLLVVLMVVCSGVYYWSEQRSHRSAQAHEIAPPTIPVTQAAAPVSKPVETPPAPSAAPSVAATAAPIGDQLAKPAEATAATPEIPVTAPNPKATVRIGITADEAVWVRADVNGKYQFSGTLQPHENRSIDADGEVVLRLGNAGGVTITLNGKPVGAVGPKGQIRTVQFTSGGFQIVSAPKLLDPLDRL